MSKKTLLKEATIRRFMKLASISPLTENFVDKIKEEEEELEEGGMGHYARDDEMEPEGEPLPGEEAELPEEPLPGEELPGEELPGEELPGEEGTGPDLSPEQAEEVAEKLAQGFAGVVEDALGVEGLLSVSTEDEGEAPMEEPPMEELPMEEPPEEEEELPGEPLEEEEGSDEDPLEETEDLDDETIDKITEKVTAALHEKLQKKKQQKSEASKKKQYIDNLAERVVNRIFSSTKDK